MKSTLSVTEIVERREGLAFSDAVDKNVIPRKLFWTSLVVASLIANIPPSSYRSALMGVLGLINDTGNGLFNSGRSIDNIAHNLTHKIIVPLEEVLFLICACLLLYPLLSSLGRSRGIWRNAGVPRIAVFAAVLFVSLSAFVLPYQYPEGLNSHVSGLSGLGTHFGTMSAAPFEEELPIYYKRLLKPAIAHFMHVHSHLAYYAFSLLLTFALIFLTVTFLEFKASAGQAKTRQPLLSVPIRWLIYLSLMTSSFTIVDFQWPGYSDHLSFILMLLLAFVPMSREARLATVALCLLNHEGIALALVPIILHMFPRSEKRDALMAIGIFYGIMIASYGLNLFNWFQGQGNSGGVSGRIIEAPGLFIAGLFFTYKLFWLIGLLLLWMLWRKESRASLIGFAAIALFPLGLTLFAWDTTRVAGFGWLGLVVLLGLFLKECPTLPRVYQHAVILLACLNLLIPSYNVVLDYRDSLDAYPYRGIYRSLDSVGRQILF